MQAKYFDCRFKKMLETSVVRGGGEFQKSFFSILAKNMQNQKMFAKQKKMYFNFGHCKNKRCLIL